MWKLRAFAVAGSVVFALATGTAAWATSGGNSNKSTSSNKSTGSNKSTSSGDSNKGDVWVDNVGQPAGPGHEMDPHLACSNINLWGNGLADSSGSYTIDGWSPSGKKGQAYSSTWSYDHGTGGTQIIDVIDVTTLIDNAVANGDKPKNKQGYHFKLQFVQDPQKHKTFWVKCSPPSNGSTPNGGTTPTTTTTTTTSSSTSPSTTTTTTTPTSAVKGTTTHRKRRRHKRHAKRVSRRPRVSSGFTG